MNLASLAADVINGKRLSFQELMDLSQVATDDLVGAAGIIRDAGFGHQVTYSRKVFVPLTELCRNVCHYCAFAKAPRQVVEPFMSIERAIDIVRKGQAEGCNEVLLTLGEKPELRYDVARQWLHKAGFRSTIDYLVHVAGVILRETGLLPHINAGTMTREDLARLRQVSPSMGLMLEASSERLCKRGMPHFGSPDKQPKTRLETLRVAGELRIPMTSGILVGIGETHEERIQALLALRELHDEFDHIQEIIIQNFRAKLGTRMAGAPEPTSEELCRVAALARFAFGPSMSIQAPPNLSPDALGALVRAGINDWGGVSPITPDHVNPEAPWPHLELLAKEMRVVGKELVQRLTIYPRYIAETEAWIDKAVIPYVLRRTDAAGLSRECNWISGGPIPPPAEISDLLKRPVKASEVRVEIVELVSRARSGERLNVPEVEALFAVRGADMAYICQSADALRQEVTGDTVSYIVTRNINYTNVCAYGCKFCAFSKGKTHENLRGKPYDLTVEEIRRRTVEAWKRGAVEVCLQGGIHPDYTGETYISIVRAVKEVCPEIHVHAFSPLEVSHGAASLNMSIRDYLFRLKEAGLGSLPGTAGEILDDEVRAILCPDKISTDEWLNVIEIAHEVGLRTTSTIMFGHVERPVHWAHHLLRLRDLQARTGGITEFVPLPFVASQAPIFLRGRARPGPTFREAILMHAVARLVLHPHITNIQASWVKLGPLGVELALRAGVNDLGGTLMNESISRAAGAIHGQEASPELLEEIIRAAGRLPRQRTTFYADAPETQRRASFGAPELAPIVNTPVLKRRRRPGDMLHPAYPNQ